MRKSYACLLWAVLALGTGTAFSQTPQPAQDPDPFAKIAARPAQPAVEGGLLVEVVDHDGEPLAGAAVVVITLDDMQSPEAMALQMERGRASATDPTSLIAELAGIVGTKFVTDEKGRTSVTYADQGVVIAFRNREVTYQVLESPFQTADRPIRLAFVPPIEFEVEVVDALGRPAKDVPVGISPRRNRMTMYVSEAQTDVDGHARLSVKHELLQGSPTVFIELVVPLSEPLYREIELSEMDSEPTRFELPPTGQLRVIIYDEQDRPRPAVQSIMIRESVKENVGLRLRAFRQPMYSPSILEEDNAIFSHVGLGLEFEAIVRLRGIEGSVRGTGVGPTRPREMTIIPVRAVESPPILTLRLRDAQGQPIANETVGVAIRTDDSFRGTVPSTSAEGVLRIALDEDSVGDHVYLTILRRGPGPLSAYRGAARIYLSNRNRPWENPVTDLVVEEEPVLVSGRVVDGDGKPLSGVAVRSRLGIASGASSRSYSGRGGFFEHRVETDEQGHFTIRELPTDAPAISLQVNEEGYALVSETEFAPGSRDAQIVLARAGRVLGSFTDAPPRTFSRTLIRLVSGPEPDRLGSVSRDGSFTFDRVLPGTYSLEVVLSNSEKSALVVPDLSVEAGQSLRDPRIQNIDWKAFARLITITTVDELRHPLPGVPAMHYKPSGTGGWRGSGSSTDRNGEVTFLIERTEAAKFAIESKDHMIVHLENVTEDREVVLRSRPVLQVSLNGKLELPEDIRLVGRLSLIGPMSGMSDTNPSQFDAQGVARIPVPSLEPLELTIMCVIPDQGINQMYAAIPSIKRRIVIDPETGPESIEIELTDEHRRELQRYIELIRRLR